MNPKPATNTATALQESVWDILQAYPHKYWAYEEEEGGGGWKRRRGSGNLACARWVSRSLLPMARDLEADGHTIEP